MVVSRVKGNASALLRRGVPMLVFAAIGAVVSGCAVTGEPPRPTKRGATIAGPAAQPAGGVMVASAAGKYLAGRYARHTRDFVSASEYLTDALSIDSTNNRIRRQAFFSLIAGGRTTEAGVLAREILADNKTAPIANLSVIVEDVVAGRFAEAEGRLKAVPQRGMNTFTAPLLLAWVQGEQGRLDDAAKSLEALKKISSFAALRHLHLGLIFDLYGRKVEAEQNLAKAIEATQSLRVVEAYGRFLEMTGRVDEAKAIYDRFDAKNPNSETIDHEIDRVEAGRKPRRLVTSVREGMSEVFFNLAGTLAQGRSSELSLIYGRLAVRLRPDFPVAQLLIGGLLESLSREAEAAEVYRSINPASPLAWSARLRLSAVLDDLKQSDEAIRLLREMANERREREEPLIRLGDLLRAKKRFEEAGEVYSDAIRRVGKLEKPHWSLLYARGIAYERSKRWDKAEADFLRALDLSPEQPFVLNYLGYSWVDQGVNLARARKMIERAVELRPNDGYIVDSLGWVLFRLGDYDRAAEQLERAVVLRPEDPTINDHLGDAYWKVGRILEARFQWQRALTLEPDADQVPLIRSKLERGLPATTALDRRG